MARSVTGILINLSHKKDRKMIGKKRKRRKEIPPGERCTAVIYVRDCLRVSRGHGFRMHYCTERCSRKSVMGNRCKQHKDTYRFSDYPYMY